MEYEILSEDDLSKSEIREIETYYDERYGCTIDIKEAKVCHVDLRRYGEWYEEEFCVLKIGSKWYLEIDSLEPFW